MAAEEIGPRLAAMGSTERPEEDPTRLTRVGEAERWWKKSAEREEKAEVGETAKAEVDEEAKAELPVVGEE